jgi:quercetin dioxygenase-like cupin family protein
MNCVQLSCSDGVVFNASLEQLLKCGFRVVRISPADGPTVAEVVSADRSLALRLVVNGGIDSSTLLLKDLEAPVRLACGTQCAQFAIARADASAVAPPRPHVSKVGGAFAEGRAGMHYRNLIGCPPGQSSVIASLISVPDGAVADYVHFHVVKAQIIFVLSGAVTLLYEGQGEAFVAKAGSVILQPPGIRHRVLQTVDNVRVLEVSSPAVHDTFGELDLVLPTERFRADHEWGGQRFVFFNAETSDEPWRPWRASTHLECRESGIAAATKNVIDVQTVRATSDCAGDVVGCGDVELFLLFVICGEVSFQDGTVLRADESITLRSDAAAVRFKAETRCALVSLAR